MSKEEKFLKAVKELRKSEVKRKFDQTVDLIVNLKNFDARREAFNLFITLPHKVKDKKIAGFFEKDSKLIDIIKQADFARYKDKKDIKRLIKKYDAFIANAKLMPAIATSFGRILGPAGKMPSPQLGILPSEDENLIKSTINKINSTVRVIVKEPSIKIGIGKESLSDEDLLKNILVAYNKIVETLPKKQENVYDIKIKLTMGKPVKVEL